MDDFEYIDPRDLNETFLMLTLLEKKKKEKKQKEKT